MWPVTKAELEQYLEEVEDAIEDAVEALDAGDAARARQVLMPYLMGTEDED